MCPDELDEHSFVWKSHMRHQPIFVAAYVKHRGIEMPDAISQFDF
jgi:hypothetical protein